MELLKSEPVMYVADMNLTLVFLKATLLVCAFALVAVLARRVSAAGRASLWLLAFGALLTRTPITRRADGTVQQVIETSEDGGETWQARFDAVYARSSSSGSR